MWINTAPAHPERQPPPPLLWGIPPPPPPALLLPLYPFLILSPLSSPPSLLVAFSFDDKVELVVRVLGYFLLHFPSPGRLLGIHSVASPTLRSHTN
ncbi:hypothetical protein L207DRAFT_271697 [Hyaloscypha variabilis F]|uniref:Uncharacterized protein n=1 Tax=Hyaloscypha variabilis (strain UAMH 11265 / GT02V1 / F) TaxID=1149755 RepID=A0A2J6RZZ6_HYAVF|nr:hypothetical protein L207DRAFT_271697 [Hyaloscypha variabilis F]